MRNLSSCFVTCCNLLLLYVGFVMSSNKCVKVSECECILEGSKMGINLNGTNTTTASNFNERGYSVTFNPCRPVNLTGIATEKYNNETLSVLDRCNDTSLICLTVLIAERISIGTHDTLNFETDNLGRVYLKFYSNGWSTIIRLECNNTTNSSAHDTLEVIKFDKTTIPKTIELKLRSNSSCLVEIPVDSGEGSGWATFFEVLFVIAFVYFVGGMLFKKIFFDAQGMEMLPNHLFWISVIESIEEFAEYVSNGCRPRSAYNEI